jgi:hypothetical protein
MKILQARELERLVRATFPQKGFCAEADLPGCESRPLVAFVHGSPDPYFDHHFDAWLSGSPRFISAYELLNRLCRAGALPPGQYALVRPS